MIALIEPVSRQVADARLRDLHHRTGDAIGASALLVVAAAGVWGLGMPRLAVVLVVGAVSGLAVAGITRFQRRDLLTRLVAQGDALAMPAVRRHAQLLTGARHRLMLARGLERAALPGGVAPSSRAKIAAPALRRIAGALRDLSRPVEPAAVALTRAMLELGAASPLLNEKIAESELRTLLARIQAGVSAA